MPIERVVNHAPGEVDVTAAGDAIAKRLGIRADRHREIWEIPERPLQPFDVVAELPGDCGTERVSCGDLRDIGAQALAGAHDPSRDLAAVELDVLPVRRHGALARRTGVPLEG